MVLANHLWSTVLASFIKPASMLTQTDV